mgnify:CR=1 FL=1
MEKRQGSNRTAWLANAKGVGRRFVDDAVLSRAAEISFYYFLSVFPLLLILMAVLGLFLDARLLVRETLLDALGKVAPGSIIGVFDRLLLHLEQQPERPLSFGILVAVWAASSGMVATIRALNKAYGVVEERPWWRRRLVAIALTLGYMLLAVTAMVLFSWGSVIAEAVAQRVGLGTVFVQVWRFGQWPAIVFVLLVAFHLLYRYAPHRRRGPSRWLQPGTLIGIGLWLAASSGLKLYIANFAHFDVAYGSLGAVIVLLLWFYVTGIAVLTGAEINAQLEGPDHGSRSADLGGDAASQP